MDVHVKVIEIRGSNRRRLVTGIVFVAVGLVFLFDRLFVLDQIGEVWRLWPLILVTFGLSRVFSNCPARSRRWGLMQVFLGIWLLLDQIEVADAGDSWPILVMAIGVLIVIGSFQRQAGVASGD